MAKIVDITKDGQSVYPRTIADAVAVSGKVLTDALEAKADKKMVESIPVKTDKSTIVIGNRDKILHVECNRDIDYPQIIINGNLEITYNYYEGIIKLFDRDSNRSCEIRLSYTTDTTYTSGTTDTTGTSGTTMSTNTTTPTETTISTNTTTPAP